MAIRTKFRVLPVILALSVGLGIAPPVHSDNEGQAVDTAKPALLAANPVERSLPSTEPSPKANVTSERELAAARLLIFLELLRSRR
jgi:hypothetical protein